MRCTRPRRSQRVCEFDYYNKEENTMAKAKKKVKKAKQTTPAPVPKKKKK